MPNKEDLSMYYDPMDPGFPDRGTQVQMDEYLRSRRAKNLLNASAAIAKLHAVAPIAKLHAAAHSAWEATGKTRTELVAEHRAIDRKTINELTAEVKRLQDIIDRAKAESELIQSKGRAMVAVPYWFIKA